MAQAAYTDPNAPAKRKAQQLQEQSRQRIAQRASGGPSVTDGLTPRPATAADPGLAGTATQAEYDAAVQRARAGRGNAPAPAAQARPIAPSTLTPAEAASFESQTGGRFSKTFPSAPTVANAQARTNAPAAPARASITEGLAPEPAPAATPRAGSRLTRLGAAPVQTVPGRIAPRTAPGQRGGTGAVLATSALLSAADSVTRDTESYRKRLGLDPEDTGKSVLADTGVRTAGVLSDLGAGLLDNFVVAPGNALAKIATAAGADPNGPLGRQSTYFRDDFADIAEENAAAAGGGGEAAMAAKPDFSNVVGGVRTTAQSPAERRIARQAANEGITPVADRVGDPNEVLGTFQGRPITRVQSDQLSGAQSFGGTSTPSVADGLSDYRPPTGGVGSNVNVGGGAESRLRDIADTSTKAGALYAQLSADKTPTGKRVAAQFLSEYLGTGTAERGQDSDLSGRVSGDATALQRGREGDAAGLEQERIRGRNSGRAPQYVFNDDGTIGQISDGVLSAVTDASGKPAKTSVRGKSGMSLKEREGVVTERLQQLDPNNELTPDERAAARAAVLAELEELTASVGAGLNG